MSVLPAPEDPPQASPESELMDSIGAALPPAGVQAFDAELDDTLRRVGAERFDVQHRITRINSEFSELFGFSAEEALGRRPSELIVPAERTAETAWIKASIGRGQKITLETRRQR